MDPVVEDEASEAEEEEERNRDRELYQPKLEWPLDSYLDRLNHEDFPDDSITVAQAVECFFWIAENYLPLIERF